MYSACGVSVPGMDGSVKDEPDAMDGKWGECLALLQTLLKKQRDKASLRGSHAAVTAEGRLQVTVVHKFALDCVQRPDVLAAVSKALEQVYGTGWEADFSALEEAAPPPPEPASVEAMRPPKASAYRPEPSVSDFCENAAYEALKSPDRGMRKPEPPPSTSRYRFDNLVEGEANSIAVQAARQLAEGRGEIYSPLVIHGGPGLGKTHIMGAMRHMLGVNNPRAKVTCATMEEFTNELLAAFEKKGKSDPLSSFRRRFRSVHYLLLEDVEFLKGKERTQEEFYHTFEELTGRGCKIILTCDKAPAELTGLHDRLRSRMKSGLTAEVNRPSVQMSVDILKMKAREAGADVTQDALTFIAEHFSCNVRELEGALKRTMAIASLSHTTRIDIGVAERALGDRLPARKERPTLLTLDRIIEKVSQYFRVDAAELKGQRREHRVANPRHIAMYLAHKLANIGCREIGEEFSHRDYSTIQHAIKKLEGQRDEPRMKHDLVQLAAQLGRGLPQP